MVVERGEALLEIARGEVGEDGGLGGARRADGLGVHEGHPTRRGRQAANKEALVEGTGQERSDRARYDRRVGPWSKIDDLRARVAKRDLVKVSSADSVPRALDELEKKGWEPDRLVILGWEILLSRRGQNGLVVWHLSAKLFPHGRSSTEADWKTVGKIAARIGAPRDPMRMSQDPNAPLHWSWTEQ